MKQSPEVQGCCCSSHPSDGGAGGPSVCRTGGQLCMQLVEHRRGWPLPFAFMFIVSTELNVETHGGWVRYLGGAPSDPNCISIILHMCLFLGQGAAAEVSSSFAVLSVCALVVLVVLLANCVSCCKDPEIDFKVRLQVRNVHADDIGSCILVFLHHCTCSLLKYPAAVCLHTGE